ncbi:MAG TPA: methyltransferase domain-containing protein [Spirochaetota bacterium]|nr:methyltransferase domain-containing protein [Spirochaetota bacterium]
MSGNNRESSPSTFSAEQYIKSLKLANSLTENAIRSAIDCFGITEGSMVLDVPCGIGRHSIWMAEQVPRLTVIGGDISEEHLACATEMIQSNKTTGSINFEKRELHSLSDKNDLYDFIWCCDGLWIGDPEQGAIDTTPYSILNEFKRVLRSGGKVAILFWSDQKLLPGYPFLEAALKATMSANRPLNPSSAREFHSFKAGAWLSRTGFTGIACRNFPVDLSGQLSEDQKAALLMSLNMLYGAAAKEISADLREQYLNITDPTGGEYILSDENYAGFVMYTMFVGLKPS